MPRRSHSVDEKPQRVEGIYGAVRGSEAWKHQSSKRKTLLPPDVRGSRHSSNAALLMLDSSAFKPPVGPGGFYNYDHIGPRGLAEEPMIREGANSVDVMHRDNRKKVNPCDVAPIQSCIAATALILACSCS